jgi:glutaminyl-tRNA synthetase
MNEIAPPSNFIKTIIENDIAANKNDGRVATRFPPEPNGYLHIGHAKSICLNFGVANTYQGTCNLRFDDTNPTKEEVEYVDAIKADVAWMGFAWEGCEHFASDYFDQLFDFALVLIDKGLAYVDSQSAEEIRATRGTLTEAGTDSPHRNRSVEENRKLFLAMRAGEFADGTHVLRAKIDMAHPNIIMRDPTLYRIRHAHHHRTGDAWCIYPMYDFTHCLSDAIEGITHSLCTLEFENNRPLYDWVLDSVAHENHPQQIEFARLNLSYTILSKRKLIQLVNEGHVSGWDDPRMPSISGLRRRGYTPAAIRHFCERIGLAKRDSVVDVALLEHSLREDLNAHAQRVMGVLTPLKLIIENYPEGDGEVLAAVNNPEDAAAGKRQVPFSRELYIEREDFMEDPPKKFFRLGPGREVRLRYAYFVTCTGFDKDPDTGEITAVRCTYDPATKGGNAPDGRKVKGTIHWVSAPHSLPAEVRLYDRLFNKPNPDEKAAGKSFIDNLNPEALRVLDGCRVEPSLKAAEPGSRCQFERMGYFCVDSVDSRPDALVFNRIVTLRDTWAKVQKQQGGKAPGPKTPGKKRQRQRKKKA